MAEFRLQLRAEVVQHGGSEQVMVAPAVTVSISTLLYPTSSQLRVASYDGAWL